MKLKRIILTGIIGSVLLLTSCGGNEGTVKSETIDVVGSTSVAPLMEKMAEKYNEKDSNVKINIQAVGSSAGIKATIEKTAQIGMSSRELKSEEKSQVSESTIAIDPIAVVTHPNNPVKNLTSQQVASIYKGEIKNWSEVGGNDAPVVVISRESGSGTRDAFEEILKLTSKKDDKTISLVTTDASIADSNGSVKQNIATKENAIGYISLGILDSSISALSIDNVAATDENAKSGDYKISRPFIVTYNSDVSGKAKEFIDYMLSDEAQSIVTQNNYLSVK